jgi:pimeloyl-ACP methyl ester carboxylesterase
LVSQGYRVTTPDLSIPSLERLSAVSAIDLVKDSIERTAEGRRVFMIGSSVGGFGGLHAFAGLSELARTRVCGMVLLAPALYPWHPASGLITPSVEQQWRRNGVFPIESSVRGVAVDVHVQFMEELRGYNSDEVLLEVPTIIIHGRSDQIVPISQSEHFCARRLGVTLVTLEEGHDLMAEPMVLMEHIQGFLGTCS